MQFFILLPQRALASGRLGRGYEYHVERVPIYDGNRLKELIAQAITQWVQQADRSYLPVHGYCMRWKWMTTCTSYLDSLLNLEGRSPS